MQRVRLRPAPSSDESLTENQTASFRVHWLNEETQPQRWTTRIVSLGRTQPAAKRGGTSTRYRTPSILKHTAASPSGLVGCSRALSENHLRSTKINPRSFDPDETERTNGRQIPAGSKSQGKPMSTPAQTDVAQRNRMPLLVARDPDRSNKVEDREEGEGRYRPTVGLADSGEAKRRRRGNCRSQPAHRRVAETVHRKRRSVTPTGSTAPELERIPKGRSA